MGVRPENAQKDVSSQHFFVHLMVDFGNTCGLTRKVGFPILPPGKSRFLAVSSGGLTLNHK